MNDTSPTVDHLIHRLAETPGEFLLEPVIRRRGQVMVEAVVNDLVYTPLETTLLKRAAEIGCNTVDGLGMLLHQAAPAFERWFGQRPTVDDELRQLMLR